MTTTPLKRIALIGSAPSSVRLAPYSDPSWTIWSCSPGAVAHLARTDVHFELHLWEPHQPWFHRDYVEWMAKLQCPVYMLEHRPEIPKSEPYPKADILNYVYGGLIAPNGKTYQAKFDPNGFGSSLSWMLALAITQSPDEIGLWGVDMAAHEEFGQQKDGCLSLIQIARNLGIKITTPPQSDLLRPAPLYGFREADPMFIKLQTRVEELSAQLAKAEQAFQEAERQRWYFKGALDDCLYVQKTWVSDPVATSRIYDGHALAIEIPVRMPAEAPANVQEIEKPKQTAKPPRKSKRVNGNGAHVEV